VLCPLCDEHAVLLAGTSVVHCPACGEYVELDDDADRREAPSAAARAARRGLRRDEE
jgi:hypothetical protein